MRLEEIFNNLLKDIIPEEWSYDEAQERKTQTLQAVKDRVRQKGLSGKKIREIIRKEYHMEDGASDLEAVSEAIHTEMEKRVEGI